RTDTQWGRIPKSWPKPKFFINGSKICYSGVFGVTDYESGVKITEFKMAPVGQYRKKLVKT
ncbi:hypothetical protein, partial [Chryseobacterium sp. RR2-3-20]|uniref:hypothetical protein n=1 Tax=Chryseobacterium sp. RR2-3-20 TaxID=2787626 RepID=UPI001AE05703